MVIYSCRHTCYSLDTSLLEVGSLFWTFLTQLLGLPYLLLTGGGAGTSLASNQSRVGVAEGSMKAVGLLGVRNRLKSENSRVL